MYDGLWFPLAVGSLAWTLVGLRTRAGWLTLTVLCVSALGSRWLHEPLNLFINALCPAVAITAAAAVTRSRSRRSAAQADATARSAELKLASDEAVREERLQVARELHDLVSHAVSVIAVQAGAAELLWPNDPAAARRAINVIQSTATQTIAELDQLMPGSTPVHHTIDVSAAIVAAYAGRPTSAPLTCGYRPANNSRRNDSRTPRISPCDNGASRRYSARPVNASAIRGAVRMFADPVNKNCPGAGSRSTRTLMASNRSGTR